MRHILYDRGLTLTLREEYTCPLELTHDMLKGKWKLIILWQLSIDFMISNGMEEIFKEKGFLLSTYKKVCNLQ